MRFFSRNFKPQSVDLNQVNVKKELDELMTEFSDDTEICDKLNHLLSLIKGEQSDADQ